jgi:hypothetical protein
MDANNFSGRRLSVTLDGHSASLLVDRLPGGRSKPYANDKRNYPEK